MTRRTFLQAALGVAGAAASAGLLAACGGSATVAATTTSAAATSPAATSGAATASAATTTAAPTTTAAASATSASSAASSAAGSASQAAITGSMTLTKYPLKANKITAWAWQSFSPDADRFIASQAQAWGKANGGQVEYDVVQNSVFNQKLAAAIEAKTVPDVLMLSDVLYYQGLNILTDLTDQYNAFDKLAGGYYKSLLPGIQVDGKIYGLPIETGPS